METLVKDIRYSVRGLLKRPAFTAIVVITLALGIGTNSAIFSVVNAILLRPLPYPNSDQLVMIWGKLPARGLPKLPASPREFVDYRDRNHSFSAVAAYLSLGRNLTGLGDAERINATKVTAGFFSVLDTQPVRGRSFFNEEDQPGHDKVAIISHGLWQRRFSGANNVIGQNLILDGVNHTIVGIMPGDFQFPDSETQIWTPMPFVATDLSTEQGSHYLDLIARIKPGIDQKQAQAEIASIAAQMQQEHPDQYEEGSGWGANLVTVQEEMVGDQRFMLLVLLGVVSFVLLIACVNVANLLLARAATRQREIAIRIALGAGRLQLIRQSLAESLLLSMTGGAIGLLLGGWAAGFI